MKIGILTFHRAHNYGAVLQCYALQEILKGMGHDVEVIDYRQQWIEDFYDLFGWNMIRRNSGSPSQLFRHLKGNLKKWLLAPAKARNFQKRELKYSSAIRSSWGWLSFLYLRQVRPGTSAIATRICLDLMLTSISRFCVMMSRAVILCFVISLDFLLLCVYGYLRSFTISQVVRQSMRMLCHAM